MSVNAMGDSFPKPYIDQEGHFGFASREDAVEVQGAEIPTWLFQSAAQSCSLDLSSLRDSIHHLVKEGSPTLIALGNLVPDPLQEIENLKLKILIDDFGEGREKYTSFFLPSWEDDPTHFIILDCGPTSQRYWQASLAHELTHALMVTQNLEIWFEEGLAQMVEIRAGGFQPDRAEESFKSVAQVPPLFNLQRPLIGHDIYALTYLFDQYVFSRFGGWETLKAMAGIGTACNGSSWYERATCQGAQSLLSRGLNDLAEKMTPEGLFRFFAVALTLNDSDFPLYSIPGWTGFEGESSVSPLHLEPGEIVKLNPKSSASIPSGVESYLIKSEAGAFEIDPLEAGTRFDPALSSGSDFLLLLREK
jgi:hypothetical protein